MQLKTENEKCVLIFKKKKKKKNYFAQQICRIFFKTCFVLFLFFMNNMKNFLKSVL